MPYIMLERPTFRHKAYEIIRHVQRKKVRTLEQVFFYLIVIVCFTTKNEKDGYCKVRESSQYWKTKIFTLASLSSLNNIVARIGYKKEWICILRLLRSAALAYKLIVSESAIFGYK